jgi:hypothetical protein
MPSTRRQDAFAYGMGIEDPSYSCSECGYKSGNRKNYRRTEDGDGHTCSTGHYTDKNGELKRQKNPYAKPR